MRRHWSFVMCEKKYLYPASIVVLIIGIYTALKTGDYQHINRVGNLIIGVGVWMTMRYCLREGVNKSKDYRDSRPVDESNKVNSEYFNKITYSIGDAKLQIHGFILVIIGSIIGSYGDKIWVFLISCSQ